MSAKHNPHPTHKNEVLGNAKTTVAQNPEVVTEGNEVTTAERHFYDTVLDKIKYDEEHGFTIEDGEFRNGLNALEWLGYSIAEKFILGRDYLPTQIQEARSRLRRAAKSEKMLPICFPLSKTERNKGVKAVMQVSPFFTSGEAEVDDLRSEAVASLLTSLANGDRENAVANAFKALNETITHGNYTARDRKTLPRTEEEGKAQRAFVATLFTTDLSTVGGTVEDLSADSAYGGLTLEEGEQLKRLAELFNAVKEAHKYASPEKWLCAQCYALNMPTKVAVEVVYGEAIKVASTKSPKALEKAINSAGVKYSQHSHEVFRWLLDEVEKNPDGLEKWVEVLNRRKATAEATTTLKECAVKYSLDDEIVKVLEKYLDTCPERVITYCSAVSEEYGF